MNFAKIKFSYKKIRTVSLKARNGQMERKQESLIINTIAIIFYQQEIHSIPSR